MPAKVNFKIYQGSTFIQTYRWESETKGYISIESISKSAPCVVTTELHELPIGWRFRIVGAGGMKEINSLPDTYYLATETTSNTLTLNAVNSSAYTAYTSGGTIEYNLPVPFLDYKARMQIRSKITSEEIIHTSSSDNGELIIDPIDRLIKLEIPASVTTEFSFTTAVYSIELYTDYGDVVPFSTGSVTLVPEITR